MVKIGDPLSSAFLGFPALFAKIVHDVADQLTQRYITPAGLCLPSRLFRLIYTEVHQFVPLFSGVRSTHSRIVPVPQESSLSRLPILPATPLGTADSPADQTPSAPHRPANSSPTGMCERICTATVSAGPESSDEPTIEVRYWSSEQVSPFILQPHSDVMIVRKPKQADCY